ncbi:MAG: M23 family metallopeptidase, partial [candidate division WOR-3 bacterium]|nr:M23 family metallopeptidase [candidate division WOR-3 bacterium]
RRSDTREVASSFHANSDFNVGTRAYPGRSQPPKQKEPLSYGRWVAVGVVLAFIAALVLLAVFVPRAQRAREARQRAQAQAQASKIEYEVSAFALKQNEIMPTVLSRAGFSTKDIGRIVPALRNAGFNLQAMRPGDSLFVLSSERDAGDSPHRGTSGTVPSQSPTKRLLYQRNVETVYRIDLDSSDCRVSMVLRNIRRTTAFVKGTIASSLYETMMAMGEKPELIANYTDIFGWEVDFFTEVQPKDSFSILFERKYCDSTCIGYGRILAATYSGQVGSFAGYRFTDLESTTDYYNAEGQNLRKTFQKSPLHFSRVSSFFGRRFHPILRIVREHQGIDYVAPKGTPVEAVSDGRVISAGWSGGYGRLVVIGHAEGYETRYGHLSGFGKGIRSGAPVKQGQVVGYVGMTGLATGPHLHYEVRKFGTPTNPLKLNPPRRSPVKQADMPRFAQVRDSLKMVMAGLQRGQPQSPRPAR